MENSRCLGVDHDGIFKSLVSFSFPVSLHYMVAIKDKVAVFIGSDFSWNSGAGKIGV